MSVTKGVKQTEKNPESFRTEKEHFLVFCKAFPFNSIECPHKSVFLWLLVLNLFKQFLQ